MGMIDISSKKVTFREAKAEGYIQLTPLSFNSIIAKNNPKGDVLAFAEIAGINGVKTCPNLLPLCHPIPIENIQISFQMDLSSLKITATCLVSTNSKTGVEMEALAGVQAALLCIYDMSKIIDPIISIGGIKLLRKIGGKSGEWLHPDFMDCKIDEEKNNNFAGFRTSIITLSDRASKGEYEDKSGPALANLISRMGGICNDPILIPDNSELLLQTVRKLINNQCPDLILTTGGTGVSSSDITPETLLSIFDREIKGIGELVRIYGSAFTSLSWASRVVGGQIGKTIIVALPGSESGAVESLNSLKTVLPHVIKIAGEK